MRSYDKVFDSLFKDKITELIFKFLIMSFYLLYEKKMKYSHLKLLSYFLEQYEQYEGYFIKSGISINYLIYMHSY